MLIKAFLSLGILNLFVAAPAVPSLVDHSWHGANTSGTTPRVVARVASRPAVSNFQSLNTWFESQPPVKLLFSQREKGALAHLPPPRVSDMNFVSSSEKQWNGWHGPGGEELSVSGRGVPGEAASGEDLTSWYDPSARAAFVRVGTQGPEDVYVFRVSSAPNGLPHRAMGNLRTLRGVTLGMSLQQIERIEGRGIVKNFSRGFTLVSYAWSDCNGRVVSTSRLCGPVWYLNLVMLRNHLDLIDITESI